MMMYRGKYRATDGRMASDAIAEGMRISNLPSGSYRKYYYYKCECDAVSRPVAVSLVFVCSLPSHRFEKSVCLSCVRDF